MFLTPPEIMELTGYVQRSAQVRWFQNHGWKFELNAGGMPKVLRAEMEKRMLSSEGRRPAKNLSMHKIAA